MCSRCYSSVSMHSRLKDPPPFSLLPQEPPGNSLRMIRLFVDEGVEVGEVAAFGMSPTS